MRRLIDFVAISSMVFMFSATVTADQVPWITDLDEAFRLAKQDNRPLLLHFWSPDCIPCLQLEETVFNKPSVTRTLGELFVPVKINAKEHPRIAARYEIRSVPWDVILTPGGEEMHRMLSPQDPNRYVAQLSAAAFRMNASLPRREQPRSAASARQERNASSASYNSPLGPPPGGSPWTPSSAELADDGVGPIGHDSSPRYEPRQAEPVGEPEEVINRFVQRDSATRRPAPERSTQRPVPERTAPERTAPERTAQRPTPDTVRPATETVGPALESVRPAPETVGNDRRHNAAGQWGQWPGKAPGSRSSVSDPSARSDRRHEGSPATTQSPRVAARREPAPPQRRPQTSRPSGPARNPVGMDGFCPVTLLKKDLWKKGDPRYGVVHRGRTYLFTGPAEKDEFLKDPDGFSPVLAGIDPVLLADSGEAVEGLRAFGLFYRKRVFLFTSEENLQRFWQQPEQYAAPVRQAMQNGTVDQLFR